MIDINDANAFLQLDSNVTGYVFDFIDPSDSREKIKEIARSINAKGWVSDWSSENPNFFRSLDLTRQIIFLEDEGTRFAGINELNRRHHMKLLRTKAIGDALTIFVASLGVAGVVYIATLDEVKGYLDFIA